jgi:hypothetical protein
MEYRQTAQDRTVCDGYPLYIHFHKQLNYTPTSPFFQPCYLSAFSYTFCSGGAWRRGKATFSQTGDGKITEEEFLRL